MIARICALKERAESSVEQAARHDQPSMVSTDSQHAADMSAIPSAVGLMMDPTLGSPTNLGLNDDILLDDLWSMMDWNVGFPSMDLASTATTPGL